MRQSSFFVYILASRTRVLYCGVTNHLERRIRQHRAGENNGFTRRYQVHRLVYFEHFRTPQAAIAREKEIKAWRREKKVALVEATNPTWEDLSVDWDNRR